jgi:ankyrin repeat protein
VLKNFYSFSFSGREESAIILLEHGADPNCRSLRARRTPLHYVAVGNSLQVLQILLSMPHVDVNAVVSLEGWERMGVMVV